MKFPSAKSSCFKLASQCKLCLTTPRLTPPPSSNDLLGQVDTVIPVPADTFFCVTRSTSLGMWWGNGVSAANHGRNSLLNYNNRGPPDTSTITEYR
jgi:hypothetical protein